LDWGIPVPVDGAEGKVLYVWFDAPIGYISNTKELLPDSWETWWKDPETRLIHFIGKDNGKTLFELIQDIYLEYGYGKEKGISVVRKGKSGAEEIVKMMSDFRSTPPKEIAGSPVAIIKDYKTLKQTNVATGEVIDLVMPATSDVLQYFTEDGTKISVRPSGTEPKIKFYIEVRGEMKTRADYDAADAAANAKVEAVRASLGV
jgi:phosphoglucomutase